ncbi:MAG: hypothetical protein U0822_12740 [Anaerolineae bacterium]
MFTREELQGVADLCQEFDVIAVTDEIYEHRLRRTAAHSPGDFPGMQERAVTCSGASPDLRHHLRRLAHYCIAEIKISNAIRAITTSPRFARRRRSRKRR